MTAKMRKPGGFLLADLIVGISLFAMLLAGLGISVAGFSGFNRYQWTRQQCTAAAIAQLDSLTADNDHVGLVIPEAGAGESHTARSRIELNGSAAGLEVVPKSWPERDLGEVLGRVARAFRVPRGVIAGVAPIPQVTVRVVQAYVHE